MAVLIIGAPLALLIFLQGCTASALEQSIDSDDAIGGWGVLIGFTFLVASGLAIPFPLASAIIFGLSAIVAFLVAASTIYNDMAIWGVVAIVLAIMAFIGWRGKKRSDAQKAIERDTTQRAMAVLVAQGQTLICPRCTSAVPMTVRFCPNCGLERTQTRISTA